MKKFIAIAALILAFGSAGIATAQSYQYPYQQQNSYYQQPTTVSYPSVSCVVLTRDLRYGSRGIDVRSLQSFLIAQNYPGGGSWMLTGYFGRATEAAVRAFQSSRGLFPSGIVDTNTRGAILARCGNQNPTYPTYPTYPTHPTYPTYPTNPTYPTYPCTLQYPNYNCPTTNTSISYLSPSQGVVGTSVTITGTGFSYSGNTVRFGNATISNVNSWNGTSLTFTVPTYMNNSGTYYYGNQTVIPGAYNVSVTNASGATSNTLAFTVTGTGTNAPTISSVTGPTSLATNTTGTWTVHITNNQYNNSYVTTSVNWGDSNYGYQNAAAPQTTYQQGQSTLTFTHSYQYAGTYNVTFTVTGSNGQSNTASATVTVGGSSSSNVTLTAYPSTGNAPLYTTFSMYLAGCSGGNFYLNYGDGTSEFVAVPADSCNHTTARSHTYSTNGTYQAQLRNSTQTQVLSTATVIVSN